MNKKITFIFFLFTQLLFAQIPSNYYDSANGLTGYALKSQLHTIITNGHIDRGYDGLYTGYVTTDTDHYYENDGTVLDIYSEKPNGADSYEYSHSSSDQCGTYNSEADCYNREHVVPQSVFSEKYPMRSDIHSVIPTDGYVNNRRSNYPYGEINNPTWTSTNGSKVGSNSYGSYTGTVFEPIDEFKGDVARMLFYFATRYETQVDSWSFAMFDGSENKVFTTWALDMLIEWHTNDPVSQREIDRNNAAYNFQGNANPFISHPEWVNAIWNPTPDTVAPSVPANLVVGTVTANTINLSWTASTDNVGVASYDVYKDGVLKGNSTTNTYQVTGLSPQTSYTFYVKAKDAAGNVSGQSNTVQGTTSDVVQSANELFFSEYIEGSSYNKALEIANFTGSPVDLSAYSIKKNSNGGGGWITPLLLTGTLNSGDVYVLANSSANSTILAQADYTTLNSPIDFNGNDPLGLFKNDVLIDIIGVLNGGTADFAKDVTLRRKPSIVQPNTTFDLAGEWDSYSVDTSDGIGAHAVTLSVSGFDKSKFVLYPNPVSDRLFINYDNSFEIKEYHIVSMLGKLLQKGELIDNQIDVTSIPNGIYFITFYSNSTYKTEKIVVEKP